MVGRGRPDGGILQVTHGRSEQEKDNVRAFWDAASCGEVLYLNGRNAFAFSEQARVRYQLEPYIPGFAAFDAASKKRVLEIGVGLGADHEQFARAGAVLSGIDLTWRAVEATRERLATMGLRSDLKVGDAENLDYAADSFDIVFSWGVIHHSPNTGQAAREMLRVLQPGGRFAVMIYHRYSLVGYMLWLRYALLTGRPFTSLDSIYAKYLESPGTKAYSVREAIELFAAADRVRAWTVLTHGDLLESKAGQRHGGWVLSLARIIWPRRLIKALFPRSGLFLLIEGYKPIPAE